MNKKLALISLAGLAVFLSGCSLPGDTTAAEQARVLAEMQQQMANLLSGMDSLRAQNEELSGMLAKIEHPAQTTADVVSTEPTQTEGESSLFASGVTSEIDTSSTGSIVSATGAMETTSTNTGSTENTPSIVSGETTSASVETGQVKSGSVLELLRKSSMESKGTGETK